MTECMNAEIRDLLPDYVAESLTGVEKVRVTTHIAECAPCRDEVALLTLARAVRPQPVHLDVSAIVATIERNRVVAASAPVSLTKVADPGDAAREGVRTGVRDIASAPSVRRRSPMRRGLWQIAAALTVAAVGSWSVYSARSGSSGLDATVRTMSTPIAATNEPTNEATTLTDTLSPRADSAPVVAAASPTVKTAAPVGVVSVGDLSDYTDAELERMLERLDKWDGASSSEVMPTLPIVTVTSGGVLK